MYMNGSWGLQVRVAAEKGLGASKGAWELVVNASAVARNKLFPAAIARDAPTSHELATTLELVRPIQ
jgi:hypothetical protein